jgi:hypothetical protein
VRGRSRRRGKDDHDAAVPHTLALLGCPIGMGLLMFFMGRGAMGDKRKAAVGIPPVDDHPAVTLAELKAVQTRLSEQNDQLEDDATPLASRVSV